MVEQKMIGYLIGEENVSPGKTMISRKIDEEGLDTENLIEKNIMVWESKNAYGSAKLEAKIFTESEEMAKKIEEYSHSLVQRIKNEKIDRIENLKAEEFIRILKVYFTGQVRTVMSEKKELKFLAKPATAPKDNSAPFFVLECTIKDIKEAIDIVK